MKLAYSQHSTARQASKHQINCAVLQMLNGMEKLSYNEHEIKSTVDIDKFLVLQSNEKCRGVERIKIDLHEVLKCVEINFSCCHNGGRVKLAKSVDLA